MIVAKYVWNLLCAAVVCGALLPACGGRGEANRLAAETDSLNRQAYEVRYKNLDASLQAAKQAFRLSADYSDGRAEALNNLAFCAFMQMDFEHSARLYREAARTGRNEIEHLIADVGMMKICQRTSMNKEFYDYRNRALHRMKRIDEDRSSITDEWLQKRLNYGISEFYIVSGIYYYYLQQDKEALEAINAIPEEILWGDTSQWLYYLYMRGSGGMYEADSPEKIVLGELGYLLDCLQAGHVGGYVYFEANAMQAIAELLNFRSNRKLVEEKRSGLLRLINPDNIELDSLPLRYARNALQLFKRYGDWYQISGTYRTIATYYNHAGKPEKALANLKKALDYVNLHHEKYYHCEDTLDRLRTFVPNAPASVELAWINDEGIKTVPEWIARLREQLSRTYAAMDCKQESDYNRNVYLDILDYTRQDKELESRYQTLKHESRLLNAMLMLVVLSLIVLTALFIGLSIYRKKRNTLYLQKLKHLLTLCRKITGGVPADAADRDEVKDAVLRAVKDDLLQMFGATGLHVVLDGEESAEEDVSETKNKLTFELVSPGKQKPVGKLFLFRSKKLRKEEEAYIRLLLPYLAWTLENGMNFVLLSDERKRLEKELYAHEQRLAEYKCQNEIKKACLSIVTGILPYIDRTVNEIHKLQSFAYAQAKDVRRGKLDYISELITKINEYNDILACWIKMRQGELSLSVENFGLDELFSVIAKGRRTFEQKHQQLTVMPTQAVVKADKSLTLFMINTLAENARKYTPEGGCIEVKAEETDTYVEISVTDNGPGLSADDISLILDSKVYDSSSIGLSTATDASGLRKQKGHGFGLMNCKGIIEKYRKTNPIFNVCLFSIESKLGKGSRFYFRLPKGIRKSIGVGLLFLFSWMGTACSGQAGDKTAAAPVMEYDSLLVKANNYANLVYDCNINGCYQEALMLADSVFHYMNTHHAHYSGSRTPMLSLYSKSEPAEQTWLAQGFVTDYYILLDVRNEAAVAALAVKDFRVYRYNNNAYTVLYKKLSKDTSLEEYCLQMQQSANNKWIALVVFILSVLACLSAYYVLYVRRRLYYRYNMEQVFAINRAIFSASAAWSEKGELAIRPEQLTGIFGELKELVPIDNMVLAAYDDESHSLRYTYCFPEKENQSEPADSVQQCFDKQIPQWTENIGWSCLPLWIESGDEKQSIGVLALNLFRPFTREEDRLAVELVTGYLSVVLYHTIIQVRRKYSDIELAEDDARRSRFEENQLHVQNMVLDNCLSTIKHETMYYPNRIKQILERMDDGLPEAETDTQLEAMAELVGYYKDVFTLLTACAARQLDDVTFRRSEVKVQGLAEYAGKYLKKLIRKQQVEIQMEVDCESLTVIGDEVLLRFLLANLLEEAVRYAQPGKLKLSVRNENGFARFDFTDCRRAYTQETLNALFYPDKSRMCPAGSSGTLVGTEYLVCKQIIREHDDYAGRRGCRINASPATGEGFTVWFTVPLSQKRI